MLGGCQLNDLPKEDRFAFVSDLTASALPVASPSGAGLLGVGFLFAFPGGVEFFWGAPGAAAAGPPGAADAAAAPSLTFYGDLSDTEGLADGIADGLSAVPARQIESGLICVTMRINGFEVPSLLDTGSPIT
eukprot:4624020-Prymnesium_polylepis.1